MAEVAIRTNDGEIIFASEVESATWKEIKNTHSVGDFMFQSCECIAIPKTSISGLQFFSHHVDQCKTSPETIWHVESKAIIKRHAEALGYKVYEELPGVNGSESWQSDIFIEAFGKRIAIEIQQSHQTLEEYLLRQRRYKDASILCFWLIYKERYRSLIKALANHRMKNESVTLPFWPLIAELPTMMLDLDEGVFVRGPALTAYPIDQWIKGVVEGTLTYQNGLWKITNEP